VEHTIDQLAPGDTIQLPGHDQQLTVHEITAHPVVPYLVHVSFKEDVPDLTTPAQGFVTGVKMPRVFTLPCLLCKNPFGVEGDLTDEATVRSGICGPCNTRTTISVLKAAADSHPARHRQSSANT
jgi:hypothetical protein